MKETRNIINHYHYWETEAIKADLDKKRHNFSVLAQNLYNDFNISTLIRNANAFLAKNVYVYGSKRYDRRGAVGTHHYTNFSFVKELDELKELLSKNDFSIVGVDNVPEAENIHDFSWNEDKHTLMVFGQEQVGIHEDLLGFCDNVVYIPQYGSVRSLNVGCASAIIMDDYCRKMIK